MKPWPSERLKIGDECRVSNAEWTHKYFIGKKANKAMCLQYPEMMSVFKKYSMKRHHVENLATNFPRKNAI